MSKIKITVTPAEGKPESKYPCLMTTQDGDIVLFKDEYEGVVIHSRKHQYSVGYHWATWNMACFTPFHGKIEIEA